MLLLLIIGLTGFLGLLYGSYYLFCLRYGAIKKSPARKDHQYQPNVSVVIATYNEGKSIARKLENTFNINYPREKMEVIVVDSSTDRTPEIVEQYLSQHPNLRLIREEERLGLASALNLGYSSARHEIVIKSDCDILLEENAIMEIVANFADPRVGAISGAQSLLNRSVITEGYQMLYEKARIAESTLDSTYIFQPFSAFRKVAVSPISPRSVADDAELALKIRKKNYRTFYDPDAIFFEEIPTSFFKRRKQRDRRAQGHIKLVLQHLDVIFNPRYGLFGLYIFPINFFMLALGPYLFLTQFCLAVLYLYSALGMQAFPLVLTFLLSFSFLYHSNLNLKFLKDIFGFTDAQFSLISGSLRLIFSPRSYMWKKAER